MIAIGIDPGLTGAISAICERRGLLECEDLPVSRNGLETGKMLRWIDVLALTSMLAQWERRHGLHAESVMAFLERPIAMPGQQISTAASSFDSQGAIRAVFTMSSYELRMVTPVEWKRFYRLGRDKDEARRVAIGLYDNAPLGRKKDHNRAESLLIARYGLRMVAG